MEDLFRKEVLENKRHRLEGPVSLVQPPVFKVLTLLIIVTVLISLCFLAAGNYTRKERVTGVIEPTTGLLRLQASQAGVISDLLVREGEYVKAGQTILRIGSAKYSKQPTELNQTLINQYNFQLKNLESQLSQQKSQSSIDLLELEEQKHNAIAKLTELDNQFEIYSERLELNQKIVKQISILKGTGYISELELQRQKDTLLSLKQQSSNIESERLTIISQIKQFESRLKKLPMEQSQKRSKLESQKADIQIQLSSVEQQRMSELRAPIAGQVSGILVKTGKSVTHGQNLLTMLPSDSKMQAVIYVPTSAFGFIQIGQETRLRYHAFPHERFGVFNGTITEISNSVIFPEETYTPGLITQPTYRVIVTLHEQSIQAYGKATFLRAGMTLDADIIIEERSLLRWLFDPVFSIKGQL